MRKAQRGTDERHVERAHAAPGYMEQSEHLLRVRERRAAHSTVSTSNKAPRPDCCVGAPSGSSVGAASNGGSFLLHARRVARKQRRALRRALRKLRRLRGRSALAISGHLLRLRLQQLRAAQRGGSSSSSFR